MPRNSVEPRTEFASMIRAARIAAGWPTMVSAAQAAGVAASNMSELETSHKGRGFLPIRHLIVALSLPLEAFFPAGTILAAADRIRGRRDEPGKARNPKPKH